MKKSDLKGKVAKAMHILVYQTIKEFIDDFLKKEFNAKPKAYPCLMTNKALKELFSENGISQEGKYVVVNNCINMTLFYNVDDAIATKMMTSKQIKSGDTYTRYYYGSHEFIEYVVLFELSYNDGHFNGRAEFAFKGNLDEAFAKLGPIEKKTNQVFKDVNGVEIQRGDAIIWVKNNYIKQAIVDGFDEDLLIVEGQHIKVTDNYNNCHIMVLNNKMNWHGMLFR